MNNINNIIAKIEKYGYKVREHANIERGKLHEECPVVYAIYDAETYQTLYGAGSVAPESLEKWLTWMIGRYGDKTDSESKADETTETTETTERVKADVVKEREYDLIYNEGGEGYNPYRTGDTPTYRAERHHFGPIEPTDF